MDDIADLIHGITEDILNSRLTDTEKADAMASLAVGMRKLVWPILLSHVPEYLLREAMNKETMTMDEYLEIIEAAVQNPATAKEMHDELKAALTDVRTITQKRRG